MPKESAAKKVPRKKVVKKAAKKTTKRAPRKKAASSSAPRKRKAPTRTSVANSTAANTEPKSKKGTMITLLVLFVVLGGSVAIGMSDTGEIGVSAMVQEKTEKLIEQGDTEAAKKITIPKNETTSRPNGGLAGKGKTTPPPPPPVIASTTATTTDVIASTTDAVIEDLPEEAVSDTTGTTSDSGTEEFTESE